MFDFILVLAIPCIIMGGFSIAYSLFMTVLWVLFYRKNESYKDFMREI